MQPPGDVIKRIEILEREIALLKKRTTFGGGGVPTGAHATTHEDGGTDALDVTTLDGFPNGSPAVLFLREDATWAEPGDTASDQPITPIDHGNSGATLTLNWNQSRRHLFTLTDDTALTLSNPVDGGAYVVVVDTGAGGFTPTWPSVIWPDDTAPDTTVVGISILITLLYLDGLAMYLGSFNSPYDVGS